MPQAELGLSLGETKAMADVDLERLRKFARRAGVPDRLVVGVASELVVGVASETAERLREAWADDPVTDCSQRSQLRMDSAASGRCTGFSSPCKRTRDSAVDVAHFKATGTV
jgi:hypothetical protein